LGVLGGAFIAFGTIFATIALTGAEGALPFGIARVVSGLVLAVGLSTVLRLERTETKQPQRSFASPEEAVTAVVAALRGHNEADLRAVLGPGADRVIDSGDRYAHQELQNRIGGLYDEKHAINQTAPGHAELDVGKDDWPRPIPIVEADGHWTFDTRTDARAIVDRRIGRNATQASKVRIADSSRDRNMTIVLTPTMGRNRWRTPAPR
jgi:hypothetical protein